MGLGVGWMGWEGIRNINDCVSLFLGAGESCIMDILKR